MKTLVVGASGATGKHLVENLLRMGKPVKIIVRPTSNIPATWERNENVTIIRSQLDDINVEKMHEYLSDCDSAASCLGHNLNFKGIYGKPRKLVANTVKLICDAFERKESNSPMRFILMNTTAVSNKELNETRSFSEKIVVGLLRIMLPPQPDNEKAVAHLQKTVGDRNTNIEWVSVRPDTLINEDVVSEYEIHKSPIRSAVFDAGKTSRINVGNFMARLIVEDDLFKTWKGQTPVLYNAE
jgi:nucleoside-diphosphate-sugar epimerase